jgi:hypothetical protein
MESTAAALDENDGSAMNHAAAAIDPSDQSIKQLDAPRIA